MIQDCGDDGGDLCTDGVGDGAVGPRTDDGLGRAGAEEQEMVCADPDVVGLSVLQVGTAARGDVAADPLQAVALRSGDEAHELAHSLPPGAERADAAVDAAVVHGADVEA